MLGSIEDAQAQVLGTDEDGTNEVPSTRKAVSPMFILQGVASFGRRDATYMNKTKKPSCRFE